MIVTIVVRSTFNSSPPPQKKMQAHSKWWAWFTLFKKNPCRFEKWIDGDILEDYNLSY